MINNRRFEEALDRGLSFEQGECLNTLHRLFPDCLIMNNQVDPIESTNNQVYGPRLYRGINREEEFIAPDFVIFNDTGDTIWIDAKLKGKAYTHRESKRLYLTLDQKKHAQYCSFPTFMLENFYILFKNELSNKMYFTKFQTTPDTIYFNNKWGVGHTPIYYLDELDEI